MGIISWVIDKRIAAYQSDLLLKHYDEVQNIYKQMRGWRHDYHNHIQVIKAYNALGQSNEIDVYLNKLDEDLTSVDTIIKSGNIMLDAILNSKLSLAASKNISINAKAAAPKTINISDIDLCVTVGNLLDNAIEACMKIDNEDERFIRVYIGIFKEQLYISVSNSAEPGVKKHNGRYMTTKAGSHGFGLLRVDNIIQKYGGYINRQNEVGVFATDITLPK
ncbi:MAG: GHKL domain-containing protein [Oscillospiraceae bacterium]|nr:GHKL domain-containing protein [Oscillospiraceae bacterium]